jgi:hypothetical protein
MNKSKKTWQNASDMSFFAKDVFIIKPTVNIFFFIQPFYLYDLDCHF